jgi:Flp pilus assembly protein TadG
VTTPRRSRASRAGKRTSDLSPAVRRLRCAARHARGEGGYSVVEAAILFPLLLMLVMAVFQVALWWHARHLAEAAAQEGARTARTYQASAADGQVQAEDYLTALGSRLLRQREVSVSRTDTTVTVRVRATVIGIFPGLRLSVDETSASPVERYVPPS